MSARLNKAIRQYERIQKSIVFGWVFGVWMIYSGILRMGAITMFDFFLGILGFLAGVLIIVRAIQLSLLLREPNLFKKLQRNRDSLRGIPWWIISPFVD